MLQGIIKKDGTFQEFKKEKIKIAVNKSATRVMQKLSDYDLNYIVEYVYSKAEEIAKQNDRTTVTVPEIHNLVEKALDKVNSEVAKSYRDYRDYKIDFVKMLDEVYKKSQSIMYIGDKDNSNTDSALVSTKRSLIFNQLNKELYQKFFLTTEELQACRDGFIYIHDMSARRDTMNCCLFNMQNVLKDGFEMGNLWYNQPKSLDTAFDVIGDVTISAASQQYGGFTIPSVDLLLEPYAEHSYEKYIQKYVELGLDKDKAEEIALKEVQRDFEQGFQGWEYKFNSVSSSRGDYPFITVTTGTGTGRFAKMASITMLNVRKNGQGKEGFKKPVLFPKIVFLYDENLHGKGKTLEDVFEAGIECSSKTMYPDWLSLSGEGYVASMYKKYGKIISPMGCVDGKEIITYKFNNKLYVESFERMWNRLSDKFELKTQIKGQPHLYMDLNNVQIYDTQKGFVNTKRIIRNVSDNFVDVHFSNGRRLLCTPDHPFEIINKGIVKAENLKTNDKILINTKQYAEETVSFNEDKAWLLGFMLCDGCYQNHRIVASIAATGEDEIESKFHKTFSKYFGMTTKTVLQMRGKKGDYKDLCAIADNNDNMQRAINYFCSKFGGENKINRQIPNEVFSWDCKSKLSFMAGMIDADGYINDSDNNYSVVQIGSTNKELALQQMALAQSLGMPAKIYHNHYSKERPTAIRYRVEFQMNDKLINFICCQKKLKHYKGNNGINYSVNSTVIEVIPVKETMYSYDVTTDSEHFEVSGVYSHNCRAFLSPWFERGGIEPADDNDKPIFVGRFNVGAVSLNLPMILARARKESKDFYEILDYYLNMIRKIHIRTYEYLGEMKASTNPLAYCQGGFLGGHLKPDDKIKPILKSATASFGITALNELQELYNGKSLVEDGQFAIDVMKYINDKVIQFKHEDGNLYAIYGTPAESLCGLQVKQFRNKYGIVENVSDREYVSNSFHCHVTENITPIQKQDLEKRFWDLFNGGKIQYVRYPIGYNIEAIRTLVKRAMELGFYEGVNLSLAYCDDCGHEELEMDVCPVCGSSNLTKIDRMNGYLSYSRVKGDTRLNSAKMAEIKDRISM